ncbi:MAG: polysaccharide deacetylase family protein [Pseudobdellovibrionaceae bacterium]|nr:polysaccharide deacetylase family protein [Pseudobdellovibrionaceae bacterium]
MLSLRKLLLTATACLGAAGIADAQTVRELGFEDRPSYLNSNEIVLTFDDGPDWNNTAQVLDILRDKGVKASFFINGNNWSNIETEPPMQDLVRRMVNEGHELGNHTQHHAHLADLSNEDIESEISAVEDSVNRIFNGQGPSLTLLRAPHGEPYQNRQPDFDRVAGIVAQHAVHIGWNIDSNDWACAPDDGDCVRGNVIHAIDQGQYGVVLLHSVHSQTVAGLPDLIDDLRSRGFTFKKTEDAVRRKYGMSSAELLRRSFVPTVGPVEVDPFRIF